MKVQILLTGSFGVGKTSMFNRFIYKEFDDKYYGTIGVRVNEQELMLDETKVSLELWDVAGEVKQDKVPIGYFKDKNVVLYVVDISRPFIFKNIPEDLFYLKQNAPDAEILVIGNKKDLLTDAELNKLKSQESDVNFDWFTSAKDGENIEELFQTIAQNQMSIQ